MPSSARTFPGGSATDSIVSTNPIVLSSLLRSVAFWVNIAALDTTRRRIAHAESGNAGDEYDLDNTNGFNLFHGFTSGYAGWRASTALPTVGSWLHIAVAMDCSSPANTPTIWFNGSAQSVTNIQVATGSLQTGSVSQYMGNRGTGDRCFNGQMAIVARWDGYLLTQTDVTNMAATGLAPCTIPGGLILYYPLDRGDSPEFEYVSGNSGIVTGTTGSAGRRPPRSRPRS